MKRAATASALLMACTSVLVARDACAEAQVSLRFVGIDRQPIAVERANVTFTSDHAAQATEVIDARAVTLTATDGHGVCRVESPRYRSVSFEVEILRSRNAAFDVVLVPSEAIVVVALANGKSYRELARELGLSVETLFAPGFEVSAFASEPSDRSSSAAAGAASSATFVAHPELPEGSALTHVEVGLPVGCIGVLLMTEPQPMWVRLRLRELLLGWQPVHEGAVTFAIEKDRLRSSLATLRCRVTTEPGLGLDLAWSQCLSMNARLTRRELGRSRKKPAPDGSLVFANLIPGTYHLRIGAAEDAVYYDRVELAPGECQDLGTIVLARSPMLRLRVVDARGVPLAAVVWIGLADPRAPEGLVFPRSFWRTELDGTLALARPQRLAVLRAQAMDLFQRRGTIDPLADRSANTLVDPSTNSGSVIDLMVTRAYRMTIGLPREAQSGERVTIEDAARLIVVERPAPLPGTCEVRLVPGKYRVTWHAADHSVKSSRDVEMIDRDLDVTLD